MAQSEDDGRVAGWTVDKFKNGALSALLPLVASHFMLFVISLNGRLEPKLTDLILSLAGESETREPVNSGPQQTFAPIYSGDRIG
jgi:hypothetical protein